MLSIIIFGISKSSGFQKYVLYFWNPDDLLIPKMMIDISPWSSCSRWSPWSACSISSTGQSVSLFRDFFTWALLLVLVTIWMSAIYLHSFSYSAPHTTCKADARSPGGSHQHWPPIQYPLSLFSEKTANPVFHKCVYKIQFPKCYILLETLYQELIRATQSPSIF